MAGGRSRRARATAPAMPAVLVLAMLVMSLAATGTATAAASAGATATATAAASAGATATVAATAQARTARLKLGDTLAGAVVTDRAGYVLLMFPREGHTLKLCIRIRSCMHDWPPVLTTGRPAAGPGLERRLLGTIPYRGRLRAVTYGGWPLHTYRFAYSAQSSVMNIGIRQFGGNWYALGPTGKVVR